MQGNRIRAFIAAGEGERAKNLALAIMEDPRFLPLEVNAEIPVDVHFLIPEEGKTFDAEFKLPKDYVVSALGRDGHLFFQNLAIREGRQRGIVVVLGGDNQVADAIFQILKTQYHGDELKYEMESYKKRLFDFEAKCFASGIPVMRWQIDPFQRLLSHAHKTLTDASLMDYRPRPVEGVRELVAACCLTKGMGPETWQNILEEYEICLAPRKEYAKPLEEINGMGPKRCKQIADRVRMVYR